MTGRFAPSPTGDLHVGNLRTALVAWLLARVGGGRFVLRVEDLDRATSSLDHERSQLADLAALGLDWDNDEHGPVWRQSDRFPAYDEAIDRLGRLGLTYECYCTRREIRTAVRAPHAADLEAGYPGTCRDLTERERAERRRTRPPALRFRSDHVTIVVDDTIAGRRPSPVDDVVLRRNDGVPAYNLAVVVDDAAQGVDQVVRGDDLLAVTGSQIALQRALDLPTPRYGHVPLVLGPAGERLAKRDGAVTLAGLGDLGVTAADVLRALATTLGLPPPEPADAAALLAGVGPDWRPPPTPVDHATLSAALAGATSRCVSKKCRDPRDVHW